VLAVAALDGSESGMRRPLVQFTVVPPKDAPPPRPPGHCGNTNNISPKDFRKLRAGESMDPVGDWGRLQSYLFTGPGTYTVQLTYDTSGEPEKWYGYMGILGSKWRIRHLLGKVPIMRLVSNPIELTSVENGREAESSASAKDSI